jgi:hypothetical protein
MKCLLLLSPFRLSKKEAFLLQKTIRAPGVLCPTQGSSQPNKVDVQGMRLPLRDERRHPPVRLLRTHPWRDETEAYPNPEDMCIDREGLSPQAKKKETVNGLRPNPFETSEDLLDGLGIHLI